MDLVRAAGLRPAAAICEIVGLRDPRHLADGKEAADFAEEHGLACLSIEDVLDSCARSRIRLARISRPDSLIWDVPVAALQYAEEGTDHRHTALVKGDLAPDMTVLVHRGCFLGDLLGADACECARRLVRTQQLFTRQESGILIHVRDQCTSPVAKCAGVVAEVLLDLGVRSAHLPDDVPGLASAVAAHGISGSVT